MADDIGYGGSTYDPNFWINADGNSTYDPTHQFKIQGSYQLPLGINFNAYFHANTGNAWTTRFRTRRFNQGRITFFVEPRGSNHYKMEKHRSTSGSKRRSPSPPSTGWASSSTSSTSSTTTPSPAGARASATTGSRATIRQPSGHDLYGIVLPSQARLGIRLIF